MFCVFIILIVSRLFAQEIFSSVGSICPKVVIVKKGESGSIMCNAQDNMFILPAYPAELVKDPTGAGDSYAGGMMGYLAAKGKCDFDSLKTAVAYGTVVASFTIEDFSLNGFNAINKKDIDARLEMLRDLTGF